MCVGALLDTRLSTRAGEMGLGGAVSFWDKHPPLRAPGRWGWEAPSRFWAVDAAGDWCRHSFMRAFSWRQLKTTMRFSRRAQAEKAARKASHFFIAMALSSLRASCSAYLLHFSLPSRPGSEMTLMLWGDDAHIVWGVSHSVPASLERPVRSRPRRARRGSNLLERSRRVSPRRASRERCRSKLLRRKPPFGGVTQTITWAVLVL